MKKKLLLGFLFILTIFTISLPIVYAEGLSFVQESVIEEGLLSHSVSYQKLDGYTTTDYGTIGNQQVSLVRVENNAPVRIVAWSKLVNSSIVGANLIELAQDYENHHPGYEVIAGINGDYYNMTTKTPINALVQEGQTIKYTNFGLDRYFSVGFTNDENLFVSNKSNTIESTFVLSIFDESGEKIIKEVKLKGFNQIPAQDETSVYYKPLNQIEIPGVDLTQVSLTVQTAYDSTYLLGKVNGEVTQVSTDQTVFTIATNDSNMKELLLSNRKVQVQKYMSGVYEDVDNIIGVGSQPLLNNQIKPFEDINDQNLDFAKARHPRSTFGFTEDGDFIIAAIDGRQTDMAGVNLREMGYIMQSLGCVDAFNLDGGGSTQLVIKKDNQFEMLNSPSDIPYRKVSNGILIVRPKVFIDGSVTPVSDSSFEFHYESTITEGTILEERVYLNDVLQESNQDGYQFSSLENGEIYQINVEVDYRIDGIDYTSNFYHHRVDLSRYEPVIEEPVKVKPSDFQFQIENDESINGFNVFITFADPDDTFVKMYLLYDEERVIVPKAVNGYKIAIPNAVIDKDYGLKLEYFYQIDTIVPISEITPGTIHYTYRVNVPDPIDPEVPQTTNWKQIIIGGILGLTVIIGGVTFYITKKK